MRRIPTSAFVHISKKKATYPVSTMFDEYLDHYHRKAPFSMAYSDLLDYMESYPMQNDAGEDTYWDWVIYPQREWEILARELTKIYAWLKTPDDPGFTDHLYISRVEYCNFGNSKPFRVRVVNRYNDNHDYYYVKRADASRIYGLELEHILAPNRIDFLVQGDTLIEEHIAGVPGDVFLKNRDLGAEEARIRIAKEFVKFSERCFAKLLGDMRSYNYVVVITQDFDMNQIRVRAIDFDQQSHEGELKVYLPQFYEENQTMVELVWRLLDTATIRQYQKEERSLMARRARTAWSRVDDLLYCMELDEISTPDRVRDLAGGLARYHGDDDFLEARSMGQLTRHHLTMMVTEDQ
ncbi:MAG: hypothetical protein MI724_14480 [Spirochaetales bacterium]|nr:hypothetical protein [Spirochaetales bacterium]